MATIGARRSPRATIGAGRIAAGGNRGAAVAAGENQPAKAQTASADVGGVRIVYQVYGDLKSGKTPLLDRSFRAPLWPFIEECVKARPIDARGHGQTGDVPGPITYGMMADDASAVARSLGLKKVDVFGWSMGGTTAILMAVRHPGLIDKQIVLSAPSRRGGWYPQVQAGFEQGKPEMFVRTPVERQYRKESATPNALPGLVDKVRRFSTTRNRQRQSAFPRHG